MPSVLTSRGDVTALVIECGTVICSFRFSAGIRFDPIHHHHYHQEFYPSKLPTSDGVWIRSHCICPTGAYACLLSLVLPCFLSDITCMNIKLNKESPHSPV